MVGKVEGERTGQKTKAGALRRQHHNPTIVVDLERKYFVRDHWGQESALSLGHRLETAGADVTADTVAVLVDRGLLNIRLELTLGLPLGEAHIVAAQRPLATYITFRHNFTLPDARFGGVQIEGDHSGRQNIVY